jgi:DNA polymerase-3 subunit epsilon
MLDLPFARVPFVVVDVETTGTSSHGTDRVTEVAAVTVENGVVTDAFHSLVNPGRPIPWFITNLTGISDAMVRDAPTFETIAGEFAVHLVDHVFVAHNAAFDWGFITHEFGRVSPIPIGDLVAAQLCTVRLARRLLPFLPRRNLDAVAHHYGVPIEGRHRALGDARATARVLLGLLRDADRRDLSTVGDLLAFLDRRTANARRRRSALPSSSDGREGA